MKIFASESGNSKVPFMSALCALCLYVTFTATTIGLFVYDSGWRRGEVLFHIHVLSLAAVCALTPLMLSKYKLGSNLSALLISLTVFFQTTGVLGSLIANRLIYQNISFVMLWNNLPIIFDFVTPILLGSAFLLLVGWSIWIGSSAVWLLKWRGGHWPSRTALTLAIAISALGMAKPKPSHYSREPLVNLFGYPGFGTIEETSKSRFDEERAFAASYQPGKVARPRNVVVMMADSLNPSHFSMFGYARATTPALTQILESSPHVGKWIGRSTCADSTCGIISTHASRDNLDFASATSLKLSDVLRTHGYRINFILVGDYDYDPQLHRFLQDAADFRYDKNTSSRPVNSDDIILDGLDAIPPFDGTPNFFFIFFFSSHQGGEKRPEFWKYRPVVENPGEYRREHAISVDESAHINNLYDNKLLQLDHYIGKSWLKLRAKGYLDKALVVFLGDHGEAVGEHGYYGHGMQLYEPFVRTPILMISTADPLPDAKDRYLRQIDVAPTTLDYLGIPTPRFWDGISMYRPQGPQRVFHEFGVYQRNAGIAYEAVLTAKDQHTWKYIRRRSGNNIVERYLFDLTEDPQELVNLIPRIRGEEIARWDQEIDEHRSGRRKSPADVRISE